MTPVELENKFKNGHLKTTGGTFWFCGAFSFGKSGDNFYRLEKIEFNRELNYLLITTTNGIAKVINPYGNIEEKKGYGGFRIAVNGELVVFNYEKESIINEVEFYLQDVNAISQHKNGFKQEKKPISPYYLFEFGE